MEKLRRTFTVKTLFVLFLTAAFSIAAIVCTVLVNHNDRQKAVSEAKEKAWMLFEQNQSLLTYLRDEVRPKMLDMMQKISPDAFDPALASSPYAIRRVNQEYNKLGRMVYTFRLSAINARSPRDEADPFEAEIIQSFNNQKEPDEYSAVREIDGEPFVVLMRKFMKTNDSCKRCHSTPEAAPKELVSIYGTERGFGWPTDRIISAYSIRVPLAEAFHAADMFSLKLSTLFSVMLLCLYILLTWMANRLIFRPLNLLQTKAAWICESPEEYLSQEIPLPAGRELNMLTSSFNAMIKALRAEKELLEDRIDQRTTTLQATAVALEIEVEERKRSEKEANAQRETLSRVFENAPSIMVLVDRECRVVEINRAGTAFVAKPKEELLGLPCGEVFYCPNSQKAPGCGKQVPCSRCAVRSRVLRSFQTGEGLCESEEQITMHRGATDATLEVLIATTPVMYKDCDSVLITLTDITELKRAEEMRLDMERRLQQTQKLESLGVLAGGIAHDFNNLLMVITGNIELAMNRLSAESLIAGNLQNVEKAAHRAADLCRQMLAYSGKGRFMVEPVNLKQLVDEMSHLLTSSISKNAILELLMQSNLPPILGDPGQLQQIVMNLIINASEAIGENEGVITVSCSTVECDSDCLHGACFGIRHVSGSYVCLEVADTGCGMDEETRQRLFEPFFTTKFTGRGLGMAAVLGIVRAHGGAIKVLSLAGKGSRFQVFFPAVQTEAESAERKEAAADVDWHGAGTVLLVDDEESVRDVCTQLLESLGYSVVTASDGKEAVELYREMGSKIDLILLDWTMPRMNGEETFRELSRLCPTVRAIIASGYSKEEFTLRFAESRISGFVQKPYSLDRLRTTLQQVMREYKDPAQDMRREGMQLGISKGLFA